jgi:tripartite-type tricarboxylate transporter receptor subunit TctC
MKFLKRAVTASILLNIASAWTLQVACAQGEAYPSRPITWIVPYAPGAPADITMRKVADAMAGQLGGTIVIQNRAGGGGTIGAGAVAKSKPDGYTILATIADPLVAQAGLQKNLPYDPAKDFVYITKLTSSGAAMIGMSSLPANNAAELVDLAKKTPNGLAYGTFGAGSFPHIIMEALAKRSGAKFTPVHYRGSPQAIQEMIGGQIAVTFGAGAATQLINDGKVKMIVQLGETRGLNRNVPTFAESGFDDLVFRTPLWMGLAAPAGTPKDIVDRTYKAARAALQKPDIKEFLTNLSFEAVGNSPEEFHREWKAEYDIIPKLIRELGIESN